jgi:hypothetical protein
MLTSFRHGKTFSNHNSALLLQSSLIADIPASKIFLKMGENILESKQVYKIVFVSSIPSSIKICFVNWELLLDDGQIGRLEKLLNSL